MDEIWKDPGIPSPGLFEVSSLGRVKNVRTGNTLRTWVRDGYHAIKLSYCGSDTHSTVHTLVCTAFHGPKPPGHSVDHINSVRSDNRPENLRWLPAGENSRRARRFAGEEHKSSRLTQSQVDEIRSLAASGYSGRKLAGMFSVSHSHIWRIVNRVWWKGPAGDAGSVASEDSAA